jgi:hypothetical protein
MAQAMQQVTAAQVLDAGRRAEADGRIEYAIQFYRHLADHHAAAPEAAVARDALSRLGQRRTTTPEASSHRPPVPPQIRSAGAQVQSGARSEKAVSSSPIRIAPAGAAQPVPKLEMPESARGYLGGRLIAWAMTILGLFFVAAGVLLIAIGMLNPSLLAIASPWSRATSYALAGPGAVLAGLILVLAGQLARAVFDTALSSRELVAIERAKAEQLASRSR